jgi:hypothetical protein
MRHTLARVREKDPVPFWVAKCIYEKGSPPVVPLVYVPFPILRPCQSLFSILESFIILVPVLAVEDTESSAAAALPAPCQPHAYIILNFSTMSVTVQAIQPAFIQKSGQWKHGLFDCFSPCDTCKLPAPALPFIPTITCGEYL